MSEERKIFEGDTKQKAVEKGLNSLGVSLSEVEVILVQEGSPSFLGFFGKPFKVELKLKSADNVDNAGEGGQDSETPGGAEAPAKPGAAEEQPKVPPVDGFFRISIIEDSMYIVVTGPQGAGRPLKADKIMEELRKAGLKQFESDAVRQAATAAFHGTPVKICPPASIPLNFKLVRDCNVRVTIDKGKMSASVLCEPPFNGGEEMSVGIIQMALSNSGIKVAPDYEAINKIVSSKKYDEAVVAAFGKQPVAGKDGYIKWNFETESKKIEIEIDDKGNVDYHKILKINTVNAGEIIGEKIDSVPGVDGFNVFNEPIKAKAPKDAKMVKGKNVDITTDGYFFQAIISGQLIIKNGVPAVVPLFEVKGDVDYSTGNIEFNGSVVVHGTVLDGFIVKSEGNIEIKKPLTPLFSRQKAM